MEEPANINEHIVKILSVEDITHNVKRFTVEKPDNYSFIPGQATDIAINKPDLKSVVGPFTFTSLNKSDFLEFTIKIYKEHDGLTSKLSSLKATDELIIHDVFGTINYKGKGVFIAGGAGITPFIAILRQLNIDGSLSGNNLIFANHNEKDIINKVELKYLLGDNYIDVLKSPLNPEIPGKTIDQDLLKKYTKDQGKWYYICGPDAFTAAMVNNLKELGIPDSHIVIEE
ncbi:FAD-binding oxidoreductase [Pedobacter ginsengisoli]|uniref:FAD-binding oxidoreductase n=1 Tax=Pedobacter ginsengisoli TaxID=363852 RepID=UPI001C12A242|nr:FAD-binding oxidoreductase [Pedobacter ginsengisoli]